MQNVINKLRMNNLKPGINIDYMRQNVNVISVS